MNVPHNAHRSLAGLSAWASRYDLLFCDVWGVVHDGLQAIPPAIDALQRFRRGGGTVVLITNAPRPRASIIELLDRMGVARDAYDALVSSGDATVDAILARGDTPLYQLGPARDDALFETAVAAGSKARRVDLEEAAYVVCTGPFTEADTPDSYDAMFARMLARKMPLICANPDIVVHAGERLVWCAGALAERYAAQGGPVVMLGKPHPLIYGSVRAEALRARGSETPKARILAIGDGIFTDIAGARDQGINSILITSGIHRDRIRMTAPDGSFTVEPAAYADLVREAKAVPSGHMHMLEW